MPRLELHSAGSFRRNEASDGNSEELVVIGEPFTTRRISRGEYTISWDGDDGTSDLVIVANAISRHSATIFVDVIAPRRAEIVSRDNSGNGLIDTTIQFLSVIAHD